MSREDVLYERIDVLQREIERLKTADLLLFLTWNCIGFCKNISGNLPDVFDDQLCTGIEKYFAGENNDESK